VALDASGNVYVTDQNGVRKIDTAGQVTTIVTGIGGWGVAVDASGYLYLADTFGHVIRRITPAGEVSTLAGTGEIGYNDGPVATATFFTPFGIAVAADGSEVFVAEIDNHVIRKISEQ
jgi:DNA-binding beta-propeller fold protein YncE